MRIADYDEWFCSLTDEEHDELERRGTNYHEAYSDYVSDAESQAYDEYKDERIQNASNS